MQALYPPSKEIMLARVEPVWPAREMSPDLFAAKSKRVQNSDSTATYPLSDPLAFEHLFGPAQHGVSPDTAMGYSAFYRCVFLIAGSIAMLDLNVYRVMEDGHRVRDKTSPAARLISGRPNGRMSTTMLWRQVVSDMLINGNGIVYIERRPSGEPIALFPIPWNRTGIYLQEINGETVQIYKITLDNGRYVSVHQDDILHIPGSSVWQICRAMSPLTAYAMSVGIGISAASFAKAYFDNGAAPDGYIKYPAGLQKGKDQADEIRNYWQKRFGGANRFAGPAILTEGGEFVQMTINAADAQLLDSRKYTATEVAMIMGVPPHMIGQMDKATSFGKGLEEQTQSFLDFTLGPHLRAIEDEVNYKLVRQSTKVAEFDREGFVRGDLKSRMEALQIALGGNNGPGMITQNEARQKLNLSPSKEPSADKIVSWPGSPKADQDGGKPPVKPAGEPPPEEDSTAAKTRSRKRKTA